MLSDGVSWQQLFELSSHRTSDRRPERAPKARVQGPTRPGARDACVPNAFARYASCIPDAFLGRDVCVPDAFPGRAEGPPMRVDPPPAAVVISPPASPPTARFLCNSKVIHNKGFSAPISPLESALTNCRAIIRILLKINGCQVLYNQHLRVFSPQPLWNQHLHKNTGGGGEYLLSYPRGLARLSQALHTCGSSHSVSRQRRTRTPARRMAND